MELPTRWRRAPNRRAAFNRRWLRNDVLLTPGFCAEYLATTQDANRECHDTEDCREHQGALAAPVALVTALALTARIGYSLNSSNTLQASLGLPSTTAKASLTLRKSMR